MNTTAIAPNEKWLENYARFGIACKGITYILIGIVSSIAAFKGSGKGLDKQDAVREIWKQPYGHVILAVMAMGFLGYVAWRWIQAFKDPEHKGNDGKGIGKRIIYALSGLIYAGLAFYCFKLLLGNAGSNNNKRQFFVDNLLDHTGGQVLMGAVALFVLGFGLYQFYQGLSEGFRKEVKDLEVNPTVREAYSFLGKLGYISRGVVLVLMGYFLGKATLNSNAKEAEGSDGVLSFLYQVGGPLLMGAIAIGVVGYGVFMLVKAKYQTIKVK